MVNRTYQESLSSSENSTTESVCGGEHVGSTKNNDGPFMYSNTQQSLLLSSYFYGYCMFSIVGGYIVHKYGIRRTVSSGLLLAGLLTVAIPSILKADEGKSFHFEGLYICVFIRALIGGSHVGES